MDKFSDILNQPEGRRLEFKSELPSKADLAKTIISFANDAGGELYVGISDHPRKIIGIDANKRMALEEKISSIIHDNCDPVILPEISFLSVDNKFILKVIIYRGSNLPYHLKNKSVEESTYIRVGSTSRLASSEIIEEMVRQKRKISFDRELYYQKSTEQLNFKSFGEFYFDKSGEKLTVEVLKKFDLFQSEQSGNLPTNALILLSEDPLRHQLFPYAKIECARFKGIIPGNFIDQKTIDGSICFQPEQAYQFVLRHISEGSEDYTGVYRNDRWEYPVIAIREVIRNAVIHRDYSISGQDIKIAIFDDRIEITSPGRLSPAVDFSNMEAGQSVIRNKILAPVFKRLGIIEQWGNGLMIIADELQDYPHIKMEWKEPGISFRVVFTKEVLSTNLADATSTYKQRRKTKLTSVKTSVITSVITSVKTSVKILNLIKSNNRITIPEIAAIIGITERSVERNLENLKKAEKLQRIGPDKGGHWEINKKG
jgi:predicted HTH transcriptional regulator